MVAAGDRMDALAHALSRRTLAFLATAPLALAQAPALDAVVVRAAFAPAAAHDGAPGLGWLRREVIARLPEWPAPRDPDLAFALHFEGGRVRIAEAVDLPPGTAVVGQASRRGTTVDFECRSDGSESWRVDVRRSQPDLAPLLDVLRVPTNGTPHSLDLTALLGHLAGASVSDDDASMRMLSGAALCGEVVVEARRFGSSMRVLGRSGGGLCVPVVLVATAMRRDAAKRVVDDEDEWALRAFAATDGDRTEAIRQVQRAGAESLPTLRAMLHGDEACRLAAIDAMLRLRAAGELPRIANAAEATMPLAVAMAATAVHELFGSAKASTRDATRRALAERPELARALAEVASNDVAVGSGRWRSVAIAAVVLAGLFGFWLRERLRG